jgi:hypothetical protein
MRWEDAAHVRATERRRHAKNDAKPVSSTPLSTRPKGQTSLAPAGPHDDQVAIPAQCAADNAGHDDNVST